jgi:hypothetical protein
VVILCFDTDYSTWAVAIARARAEALGEQAGEMAAEDSHCICIGLIGREYKNKDGSSWMVEPDNAAGPSAETQCSIKTSRIPEVRMVAFNAHTAPCEQVH